MGSGYQVAQNLRPICREHTTGCVCVVPCVTRRPHGALEGLAVGSGQHVKIVAPSASKE